MTKYTKRSRRFKSAQLVVFSIAFILLGVTALLDGLNEAFGFSDLIGCGLIFCGLVLGFTSILKLRKQA